MSLPINLLLVARRPAFVALSYSSCREFHNDVKTIENASLPSLKRGTGGRSSFSGTVATVFGATGFLGRYVVNSLGKTGAQVIIPYRSEPDDTSIKRLKLCGDLGQILFQRFDLRDPVSIRKAIKYSNVVINLIGNHLETRNFSYDDVHVKGAREIAAACREMNIECLIHVSSLNITEHPRAYILPKPLNFLPSKLKGEQAVFEEFPNAIIFRPALMFGRHDKFFWALNSRHRKTFKSIPLWAAGEKTVKQPVFVQDVASGILAAIKNKECRGKIYQAVGPDRYLLADLANYCGRITALDEATRTHHDARFDPVFISKVLLETYIFGRFWNHPRWHMCFEQIEMESETDVVDAALPTLEDLGIKLVKLESKAEHIVRGKSLMKSGHYRSLVHYSEIKPPPVHNAFY